MTALRLALLTLGLLMAGLAAPWLPGGASPAHWLAAPAAAQEALAPDYAEWEPVATRAEEAVEAARASNEALEALRSEMVLWRERFIAAQGINADRIEILREQIAALGPKPEEGATEAEEIAARRENLNEQLTKALAPVRAAEEALRRAEGLIRRIDGLIRSRQAGEMLRIGPAPVNPALWPEALTELAESGLAIWEEMRAQWSSEARRATLREQWPQTLLYLAIAAVLLARGRAAMVRLTQAVMDRSRGRARWLAAFITSLFQVVLPVLGILLLSAALVATGMLGLRGAMLMQSLPLLGVAVFGARWLGLRLYPLHPEAPQPLPGTLDRAREMRLFALAIGVLVGLMFMLDKLVEVEDYSAATRAVVYFPLILLTGLTYLRVGRILTRSVKMAQQTEDSLSFSQRGQRLVGQALVAVGVAAPFAAAVGYLNGAQHLTMATALTLALLSLLRVLHDIVVELYALFTRQTTDAAGEALAPSLISFALVLASVPLFALTWGARTADLTEVWARFREGFAIGETRISPSSFFAFLVIFAILFAATRLLQGALKSTVLPKTKIDPGGQNAIISGVGYIGVILAAVVGISTAGIDLSGLAIVFGALSVGIGFGLQNVVSNFISGIILLIERPVAEGDWIEVGGHMGIVKDISVRSTRIETFDRNDVIVPNADFISGAVKNWTRLNNVGRVTVPVGVAYGTDTRRVEAILLEIAMEHPLVALDPEPAVDFLDFGASSLDFQVRVVLRDINYGVSVRSEIRHRIAERFAEEGIEIPFAQQDIWLRNPEALRRSLPADKGEATPEEGETVPEGQGSGPDPEGA
jgi:small-conductance mechanosensitive channel